jgi:ribonuclease HI
VVAGVKKLELRTDSQFMIDCMKNWIRGWKVNGWRTSGEEEVANRLELEELDVISRRMTIRYVSSTSV